jgi:hypothetical protein
MSIPLNTSKNVILCDGGEECKKQGHLRDQETKTCVQPGSVLGRLLALRMKTENPFSAISPIDIDISSEKETEEKLVVEEEVKKISHPVTSTTVSKEESGKITVIVNNHNTNNVDGGEVNQHGAAGQNSLSTRQPQAQNQSHQKEHQNQNSRHKTSSFRSVRGTKSGTTYSEVHVDKEDDKGIKNENNNEQSEDRSASQQVSQKTIDADKLISFQEKVEELEKKFQSIQTKIMELGAEAKIQESAARRIEDLKFKAQRKLEFYKSDLVVIENDIRAYAEALRSGEKMEDDREFSNKKTLYEETNQAIQRSQAAIESISAELEKEIEKNKTFVSKIKLLQTDATMTQIQLNSAKENLKEYKKMFKNTLDVEEKSYELRGGLTKKEEILKQFSKILQENNIKPSGATRKKFYELMEKAKLSKHLHQMGVEEEFLKLNI